MNIYFLAHITSDSKIRDTYKKIIDILEKMGHTVHYNHVFENFDDLENLSKASLEERAKKLSQMMLKCDCLVFEGTLSSTGAGFLLSKALTNSIPTLFLIQRKYCGLYLADPNRLLIIKYYDVSNTDKLKQIIDKFIKFADKKRLTKRFNLMISDSLYSFIEEQSKKMNISMSDYIRNLLYDKMDGNNH